MEPPAGHKVEQHQHGAVCQSYLLQVLVDGDVGHDVLLLLQNFNLRTEPDPFYTSCPALTRGFRVSWFYMLFGSLHASSPTIQNLSRFTPEIMKLQSIHNLLQINSNHFRVLKFGSFQSASLKRPAADAKHTQWRHFVSLIKNASDPFVLFILKSLTGRASLSVFEKMETVWM